MWNDWFIFNKKTYNYLIFIYWNYFFSYKLYFIIFSIFLDDLLGQFYVLTILAISAAEAAIGLAILVIFFRLRGGISLDLINLLKG